MNFKKAAVIILSLLTTGEHNHLLKSENLKVKQFRTILKERIVNERVPIQKIDDEEIVKAHFSSETLAPVPLVYKIQPRLNQARRNLTLTLPSSSSFDIPDGYESKNPGETSLICDKLISRKKRVLIFASPK
ncbi:unnamed protein product [Adineta steineri]|uniref:Uncharacterized protein n=1 Tax=Adineta steineri TaxID=433720 RepID=A0A820JX32_9BILA|nr:unnamed protein product [Adineta steineri]CAF1407217.1 unnamed protein product [Adineta steineri]CAF4122860.1 unnamed protein product [Adineta steineri]CAF4334324.1 unnamed protein product [Adineta steineri]